MRTRRYYFYTASSFSILCMLAAPLQAGSFPPEVELSELLASNGGHGSVGVTLEGGHGDAAGETVSALGDVNGDGFDDLGVGEPDNSGLAYVLYGSNQGYANIFMLSTLGLPNGGSDGYRIKTLGTSGSIWGYSVSSAGDVNGDGIRDILLGSPYSTSTGPVPFNAGQSAVLFGSDQGSTGEIQLADLLTANGGDGSQGFFINGINPSDHSGVSVSLAGDLNNDGIDDIVIGAKRARPTSLLPDVGQSFVIFGTSQGFPAEIELASLRQANGGNGSAGFVINGADIGDRMGIAVSAPGDVNGDGIADLLLGAADADAGLRVDAGESYVIYGTGAGFPAEFELASLFAANGGDGSSGFVISGIDAGDRAGGSVASAGDINNDGIHDFIIGAINADPGGRESAGESYVVFGNIDGFGAEFDLSALLAGNGGDGSAGFILYGVSAGDQSGFSVSQAGDVNGDGIGEVIVGAQFADPGGRPDAGQAYVVYGSGDAFAPGIELSGLLAAGGGTGTAGFAINGIVAGDRAGASVSAAGDLNGDGFGDLAIVAPLADDDFCCVVEGETYVLFGRLDEDSDGVSDAVDNCLALPNPAQSDVDNDGIGTACDADFNNDCAVNFLDLVMMKANFFSSDPLYDLDESGMVNFVDLAVVKSLFFAPPGPSAAPNACAQ